MRCRVQLSSLSQSKSGEPRLTNLDWPNSNVKASRGKGGGAYGPELLRGDCMRSMA